MELGKKKVTLKNNKRYEFGKKNRGREGKFLKYVKGPTGFRPASFGLKKSG